MSTNTLAPASRDTRTVPAGDQPADGSTVLVKAGDIVAHVPFCDGLTVSESLRLAGATVEAGHTPILDGRAATLDSTVQPGSFVYRSANLSNG